MLELLGSEQLKTYIEVLSQVLLAVVVIATALARVIKGGEYIEEVDTVKGKVLKLIQFLPTIGVNPRTKNLENQLLEMKAKVVETTVSTATE